MVLVYIYIRCGGVRGIVLNTQVVHIHNSNSPSCVVIDIPNRSTLFCGLVEPHNYINQLQHDIVVVLSAPVV